MNRNLSRLLMGHAFATLAAGVLLLVSPGTIPGFVGIRVDGPINLLCYLLGAAEISLATLSYYSRRLLGQQALRLICLTFIVFHMLTALTEGYAVGQGGSPRLWANVGIRIVVAGLFGYYGLICNPAKLTRST